MAQYVSLAQQGFYKPFEMLQKGLAVGSARKERQEDRAQEQEKFDWTKARTETLDELNAKRMGQVMAGDEFKMKQAIDEQKQKQYFDRITPQTFAVKAPDVYAPEGMEGTPDHMAAVQSAQPDFSKPLHAQLPEVKAQVMQVSQESGIPIEELATKWNTMRMMQAGPPAPVAPPSVPGYRAATFQAQTDQGPISYQQQVNPFAGLGIAPSAPGAGAPTAAVAAAPPGAPVGLTAEGGQVSQDSLNESGGQVGGGMVITAVTIGKDGMPSYTLKPAAKVAQEVADEKTYKYIASKPFQQHTKAQGQFSTLDTLVSSSRENPSGAKDMAIVFAFMKAMDPESVVRESEFRAAASLGSVPQKLEAWRKKILSGQMLPPNVREEMREAAALSINQSADALSSFREALDRGDALTTPIFRAQMNETPEGVGKYQSADEAEIAAAKGMIKPGDEVMIYDPRSATYQRQKYVP